MGLSGALRLSRWSFFRARKIRIICPTLKIINEVKIPNKIGAQWEITSENLDNENQKIIITSNYLLPSSCRRRRNRGGRPETLLELHKPRLRLTSWLDFHKVRLPKIHVSPIIITTLKINQNLPMLFGPKLPTFSFSFKKLMGFKS